jgi:redox-sensitive bicupin YhaK (pirin superfamily)
LTVNGTQLEQGDGVAISEETEVRITTDSGAEALLFDLA